MIFEEIRNYLGQQNFALTATNSNELCVLRNQSEDRAIFCVIIDNTLHRIFGTSIISSIQSQLEGMTQSSTQFTGCDILFLVVSNNIDRDRSLTQMPGCRVWLVNSSLRQLIVYENQSYDFYGMRNGIEAAIAPKARETIFGETRTSQNQGNPYPGQQAAGQSHNIRNLFRSNRIPVVTIILIAVNVIWYILLSVRGNTQSSSYMVSMGGNVSYLVFDELQVWRLFTAMFMHFGIMHLFSNMLYLGFIGISLERSIGHLKFFLIYMLSGIGSGLVSAAYYRLTGTNTVSAGASGAIYGLVGTLIYLMIRNREAMRSGYAFLRIGIAILFIFYSSVLNSTVDGAAHIGGFIIGFMLGFLFLRGRRRA